jgi:hypothetical protein
MAVAGNRSGLVGGVVRLANGAEKDQIPHFEKHDDHEIMEKNGIRRGR